MSHVNNDTPTFFPHSFEKQSVATITKGPRLITGGRVYSGRIGAVTYKLNGAVVLVKKLGERG
jgi:hypothetical protein